MTDYTPTSFAQALLTALGSPVTDDNVQAVTAWEAAEGGNWHNTAHYNPLNTTLPEPGSTTVNSAGVRSYTSWGQGLQATVSTLQEGAYASIRDALSTGTDPQAVAQAIVSSPWGTKSIPLGSGTVSGGSGGSGGAQDASSGTSAASLTSNLTGVVLTAVFVLGGVALIVAGVGKATGTHPGRAAAAVVTPPVLRGVRRVRR